MRSSNSSCVTCFMIDDVVVTLTAENRLCNEDDLYQINDLDVCKKAVSQLESEHPEVRFSGRKTGKYPPGCFLYVKKHVYFTSGPGEKNQHSQHICSKSNYSSGAGGKNEHSQNICSKGNNNRYICNLNIIKQY